MDITCEKYIYKIVIFMDIFDRIVLMPRWLRLVIALGSYGYSQGNSLGPGKPRGRGFKSPPRHFLNNSFILIILFNYISCLIGYIFLIILFSSFLIINHLLINLILLACVFFCIYYYPKILKDFLPFPNFPMLAKVWNQYEGAGLLFQ